MALQALKNELSSIEINGKTDPTEKLTRITDIYEQMDGMNTTPYSPLDIMSSIIASLKSDYSQFVTSASLTSGKYSTIEDLVAEIHAFYTRNKCNFGQVEQLQAQIAALHTDFRQAKCKCFWQSSSRARG